MKPSFVLTLLLLLLCATTAKAQYSNSYSDSLLHTGDIQYKEGDYAKSKATYSNAVHKFDANKSDPKWVISAVGLGASQIDLGEVIEGANWIFKADSTVLNSSKNDIPLELQAYVKSNVAWATWWLGDSKKAYEEYKKGLDLAIQSKDEYRIAQVSNSIAILAHDLGMFSDALEYAKTSVDYFRLSEDQYRISMALSNLSTYYSEAGLNDNARTTLIESLDLKQTLGNQDLIASDYLKFAELYIKQGNFDLALNYYIKYLEITEVLYARGKQINALHSIGIIYNALNKPKEALHYFEKSADLAKQVKYKPNPHNTLAMGDSYKKLGDLTTAQSYFKDALNIFLERDETLNIATVHIELADLYRHLDKNQEALREIDSAEKYINLSESLRLRGKLNQTKSVIYTSLKDYPNALNTTHKALKYSGYLSSDVVAEQLMNAAKIHHQIGSDSSFVYANYAFEEIERTRLSIQSEDLQPSLFKEYSKFYNEVASWYLTEQNNVNEAFELIERSKSRTLLDKLASNVALEDIVDESELIEINQAEQHLKKLYRTLDITTDSVKIRELRDDILKEELNYEKIINELYINNADLKRLSDPSIASIEEIQNLNTKTTAFIEYFFTDDKLYTIWITDTDKGYFVSETNKNISAFINDKVNQFREAIEDIEDFDTLHKLSEPIYNYLLKAFIDENPNKKKLVIIPDKSIAYLPFDALITENSFLIENYNFKYLPSASLYKFISTSASHHTDDLLAFAGSNFSNGDNKTSNANVASLPASLLEIDFVSNQFESPSVLYENNIAKQPIKEIDLSSYKYIHLASHAYVNEENPLQSGLLLSSNNTNIDYTDSNYLTSLEISNLTIAADLVVLSACNTGYGNIVEGEGLLGLQRSFLKAGAASVMVSLWSIYDRSTAYFMGEFYNQLNVLEKEEMTLWNRFLSYFDWYDAPLFDYKAKANRDAKLFMLKHPYYNHPVYWAPFILIGK